MVGLICAMEKELALVRASFAQGSLKASLSGIGKVNAALAAEALIASGADCILNIGVAGALNPSLCLGDCVICSGVAYHDVWCGEPNLPGQVQGLPAVFKADPGLLAECAEHIPGAKIGKCICGDRFISNPSEVSALRDAFPDALCVDMESAAVAQCCHLHSVPFVCIKILSDSGNGAEYEAFWQTIAERSFNILKPVLNSLCK